MLKKKIDLTLNLRAGGVEGLEASRVSSWFSSSRNLKQTIQIINELV